MKSKRIKELIQSVEPQAQVSFDGRFFHVYLPRVATPEDRERITRVVRAILAQSENDPRSFTGGWCEGRNFPETTTEAWSAWFDRPRTSWARLGLILLFFVWMDGCQRLETKVHGEKWLAYVGVFNGACLGVALWLFGYAAYGYNTLIEFLWKSGRLRKARRRFSQEELGRYHTLLQKAADPSADPEAQFQLAMQYLNGTAPENKGEDVATAWLQEAANKLLRGS